MDHGYLRDLLVGGETLIVEFKSGSVNDSELVEAVACLANGGGGILLVGVDDDGKVVGAAPRHGRKTHPTRIESLIANKTEPSVLATVSIAEIEDTQIIVVTVPVATTVVATNDGRYIRRAIDVHGKPQCLPMRPHEVLSRAGSLGVQDYSLLTVPELTVEDLATVEMDRFRESAKAGGDDVLATLCDLDLLQALGFAASDHQLRIGALLLFGTPASISRRLPAFEVGFQELDGLEIRADTVGCSPLLRALDEIVDRVQARNPEEEIEVDLVRVRLPRFADTTIRELVANALVHRDYKLSGPTLAVVTGDALEVSNPGGLPEGVTLRNLLTTPPRPRNPALADAFKGAGLVERTGRGVNRAFVGQLVLGRHPPDYARSTTNSVVARVRSGPADKKLAGYIARERSVGEDFTLEDLLVLYEVRRERRITTARAAELFQVDQNEARSLLNRLVDRSVLEARGEGKGRTYYLAAALHGRFGESSLYSRNRGFDHVQQEQMIFTFVDRHGSITRREAVELCQIDSERASRLLRRLRDDGELEMHGTKRSAYYVRTNDPNTSDKSIPT